jgi:hypothetical protein
MKRRDMTEQQSAELIDLRKQGEGIVPLAKRFGIGVEQVRSILTSAGVSTQSEFQRIAWTIKAHPDWTDGQVAKECDSDPRTVANRRDKIIANQRQREHCEGVGLRESVDRGPPHRVCRKWLRANCSRGERNVRQIQAMCVIAGLQFTIAEIKASCATAGLCVDTFGNVASPAKQEANPMIAITNISRGIPDSEPHEYTVSINLGKPLAKFSHLRGDGLAACLRAAADAIDNADHIAGMGLVDKPVRVIDDGPDASLLRYAKPVQMNPREINFDDSD